MNRRTTIHDIARALNLNSSTVSRGLKNHSYISESTARLIQQTALEMNYKPNNNASNLRTGGSNILGVIVPRINMSFFSDLIAGIEEITNQQGYHIIICQSYDSFEKEQQCINALIHQNVACIMISLAAETKTTQHLKEIISHGIPLIQFDRVNEKLKSCRVVNNEEGVFQAIEHLAQQGYRRIAHLAGPQHISIYRRRKEAFVKALLQKKISVADNMIIGDCFSKEKASDAVRKLLSRKQRPDAIIASADFMTLATLDIAREMNIEVPQQLGICGYANEDFTGLTYPSLSSISQNSVDMGKAVANLFFEQIKQMGEADKKPAKEIIIGSNLIIRASSLREASSRQDSIH